MLIALMLVLVGCSSSTEKPEETVDPDNTTLLVGTWNIGAGGFSEPSEMSEQLSKYDLDIVGFQEIDMFNGRNDVDQLEPFKTDKLPYTHWAKGRDFSNGGFGLGVASAHELLETSSIPLETTSSRATKILERTVIEKDGKMISLYNLHTSWETIELRQRQFLEIIDRVNEDPNEYKIIIGDFNADQFNEEFDIFLNDFKFANGKDGVWHDTFPDKEADPDMKVHAIDNIVVTKNMNILDVKVDPSDKSDHLLFMANLELLDEDVEVSPRNIALGTTIHSDYKFSKNHYVLLDGNKENSETISEESVELVLDLQRIYDISSVELFFGDNKPSSVGVSTSSDGLNYDESHEYNFENALSLNTQAKYIKVNIEVEEGKSYSFNEIEVMGTPVVFDASESNLFADNSFSSFNLEEALSSMSAWNVSSNLSADKLNVEKIDSGLKVSNLDEGNFMRLYQNVKLNPNRVYTFSFDLEGKDFNGDEFAFGIDQFDKKGNSNAVYKTRMIDNLNINEKKESFIYTFTTSSDIDYATLSLEILNTLGHLNVTNMNLFEGVRTQQVFLIPEAREISTGSSMKINANVLPSNANDFDLEWVSSDESIATVDQDGNVTAIKEGNVMISLVSKANLKLESSILIKVK